jgi:hypothetical protein
MHAGELVGNSEDDPCTYGSCSACDSLSGSYSNKIPYSLTNVNDAAAREGLGELVGG